MKKLPLFLGVAMLSLAGTSLAEPADKSPQPAAEKKEEVRLRFQAYDGDPAKPESLTVLIVTPDLRQPAQFLRIGERVMGTNYRVTSLESKMRKGKTGLNEDVSELTLTDTQTKKTLVLQLPPPRELTDKNP